MEGTTKKDAREVAHAIDEAWDAAVRALRLIDEKGGGAGGSDVVAAMSALGSATVLWRERVYG